MTDSLRNQVRTLLENGLAADALRALRKAGEDGGDLPLDLRLLEVRAHIEAGLDERAAQLLAGLRDQELDLHQRYRLAVLYQQAGKLPEAEALLRSVVEEDDDYADTQERLEGLKAKRRSPRVNPQGDALERLRRRYRNLRFLGRGAASVVYAAFDPIQKRDVAVKLLSPKKGSGQTDDRFMREARLLQRLEHPHIVKVHEVLEDPLPHYVMEWVRGESLRARVSRLGPLDGPGTRKVAEALLGALEAVHAAGIVHRDVKPSNILIDQDDEAFLSDFGLAGADDATRITQTGQAMGTLGYMAPEQLAGSVDDPRSDLFGLGATLYHCLTGYRPFRLGKDEEGRSQRIPIGPLEAAVEQVRGPQHGVPPALMTWVETMMHFDPEQRYQSATEALAALTSPG